MAPTQLALSSYSFFRQRLELLYALVVYGGVEKNILRDFIKNEFESAKKLIRLHRKTEHILSSEQNTIENGALIALAHDFSITNLEKYLQKLLEQNTNLEGFKLPDASPFNKLPKFSWSKFCAELAKDCRTCVALYIKVRISFIVIPLIFYTDLQLLSTRDEECVKKYLDMIDDCSKLLLKEIKRCDLIENDLENAIATLSDFIIPALIHHKNLSQMHETINSIYKDSLKSVREVKQELLDFKKLLDDTFSVSHEKDHIIIEEGLKKIYNCITSTCSNKPTMSTIIVHENTNSDNNDDDSSEYDDYTVITSGLLEEEEEDKKKPAVSTNQDYMLLFTEITDLLGETSNKESESLKERKERLKTAWQEIQKNKVIPDKIGAFLQIVERYAIDDLRTKPAKKNSIFKSPKTPKDLTEFNNQLGKIWDTYTKLQFTPTSTQKPAPPIASPSPL